MTPPSTTFTATKGSEKDRYYRWIVENKIDIVSGEGFEIAPDELHPALKPHTADAVRWAASRGRRGRGHELNPDYYKASIRYCADAEVQRLAPTLFDLDALAASTNGHEAAEASDDLAWIEEVA